MSSATKLAICMLLLLSAQKLAAAPAFQQQAYIMASNADTGDYFGWAVAISGNTLVVGARFEDSNATVVDGDQANNMKTHSGAAYVFTRDGSLWSQQAYLKASNSEDNDEFGWSVAVSGDTVVVGAYWEDSDATGVDNDGANNFAETSGAAYVFTRTEGVWSQQAYLKASNTLSNDQFGYSVAISGDTVVVGARAQKSAATGVNSEDASFTASGSGAAYVFKRTDGVWSQQAYLKASNTGSFDQFGYSVAISGDTVLVGANGEASDATGVNNDQTNDLASGSGAAYVFTRTDTTWSQQAYLKASNTEFLDQFGWTVAVSGDTLVVGAVDEASNATGVDGDGANNLAEFSGAAYVFSRTEGVWSQQAYLKASNTDALDRFGGTVAISGNTVVVGADREDSNATGVDGDQDNILGTDSGAAYVFNRKAGIWRQQAYLKASNTESGKRYGISVGMSRDTLLVGAYLENGTVVSSGAAYAYLLDRVFKDGFEGN